MSDDKKKRVAWEAWETQGMSLPNPHLLISEEDYQQQLSMGAKIDTPACVICGWRQGDEDIKDCVHIAPDAGKQYVPGKAEYTLSFTTVEQSKARLAVDEEGPGQSEESSDSSDEDILAENEQREEGELR